MRQTRTWILAAVLGGVIAFPTLADAQGRAAARGGGGGGGGRPAGGGGGGGRPGGAVGAPDMLSHGPAQRIPHTTRRIAEGITRPIEVITTAAIRGTAGITAIRMGCRLASVSAIHTATRRLAMFATFSVEPEDQHCPIEKAILPYLHFFLPENLHL